MRKRIFNRKILLLVILSLIGAGVQINTLKSGHPWIGGSYQYLIQADGVISGTVKKEITTINELHERSWRAIPGVYPWGYSLTLAAAKTVGLDSIEKLKYLNIVFLIAASWLWFFVLFKKIEWWALVVFILLLFNPYLLYFKNIIYSDICFLFVTALFFYYLSLLSSKKITSRQVLVLGALLCFATMVRSQGALLIFPCFYMLRKKMILVSVMLFPSIIYFAFIRPWVFPESGYSYFSYTLNMFEGVIDNMAYYLTVMDRLFYFRFQQNSLNTIVYWIMLLFFFLGIIIRLKKERSYIIYFVANMGLLIFWPFQEGPRFIVFLLPIIFYFAISGVKWLGEKAKVFYIVPVLVLLLYAKENRAAIIYDNYSINSVEPAEQEELFTYVKSHPGEYVFYRPRVLYYYTGVKAAAISRVDQIESKDFIFIKADNVQAIQLSIEALEAEKYHIKSLYKTNHFEIFSVKGVMK